MSAIVLGPAAPPRMIGGWGCWTGLGHAHDGSSDTCSPLNDATSSVHSAFMSRTFSRRIARRSVYAVPWLAISSLFQPYPIPNSTRPPERWSRVATSLAVQIGSRWATRLIPVASFSVVVAAAVGPKATNCSWVRPQRSGRGGGPPTHDGRGGWGG